MLGSFVGNVWAEHSDAFAAVFLDERADEKQRDSLQMIFGEQAGAGPLPRRDIRRGDPWDGVRAHRRFHRRGPRHVVVDIPGKATATVKALTGPTTPERARVQVH